MNNSFICSIVPPSSKQPYTASYSGCFADNIDTTTRYLDGLGYTSLDKKNFYGGSSVESCVDLCSYHSFNYAGLLNG
jgi:hypothetical protein